MSSTTPSFDLLRRAFGEAAARPHLHFMGIGGIGMSGLARWFAADGFLVSGCDASASSATEALTREGVAIAYGHDPRHLEPSQLEPNLLEPSPRAGQDIEAEPLGGNGNGATPPRGAQATGAPVDLLIHSMAIRSDHPEIRAARAAGIPVVKRIALLGELFRRRQAIAVTGTHGKSTTTGMIATIYLALEQDPSVLLGATLPGLGNVRYGRGPTLVAEVDESDPGFAELAADIAVLTNLEDDHVAGEYDERRNYHASLAELEAAARKFAGAANTVIYCADWPGLAATVAAAGVGRALSYGLQADADYRVRALELLADGSRFELHTPAGRSVRVSLQVPGRHNVLNAAAALAASAVAGLPLEAAAAALAAFPGVGRRWQRWGEVAGALIIDDYAHHPTEVEATLQAARDTGRRVRAVLQPHRWVRTARHWPALADAAALADEVLVVDIFAAGEKAIPGVGPELIVERLTAAGRRASRHDLASASAYLATSLAEGDLVITLGAGDVWQVAASLTQAAPRPAVVKGGRDAD